ncbi:MAG TPA: S8 family serine peptidase, partial [Blastocatellia bacterium]|nr:S8 family serine peptidase [Blastocatellia bacterium]
MFQRSDNTIRRAALLLLAALMMFQGGFVSAVPGSQKTNKGRKAKHRKIAPDLDQQIADSSGKLSSGRLRPVILQLDDFTTEAAARNAIALLGGRVRRFHNKFRLMTVELKNSRVRDLEADDNFTRVSPDREVTSQGHLEVTTAAAQARTVVNNSTLDGSGVGIAILDSGIDASHQLLAGTGGSRVVYSQDFTSDNITGDTYGHGTHVASLAAGAGSFENGAYTGVAPGASLINLRVLGDDGRGSASNIIAALDWCIANKDAYNIRVINLSLGSI